MEVAKLGECQVPATDSYFAPLKEQSLPEDRCIAEDRKDDGEMERQYYSTPSVSPCPWPCLSLGFAVSHTQKSCTSA